MIIKTLDDVYEELQEIKKAEVQRKGHSRKTKRGIVMVKQHQMRTEGKSFHQKLAAERAAAREEIQIGAMGFNQLHGRLDFYYKLRGKGLSHDNAYKYAMGDSTIAEAVLANPSFVAEPLEHYGEGRMIERTEGLPKYLEQKHKPDFMPPHIKKLINKGIHEAVKETHYDEIPLQDIFDALEKHGVVPLQEDGTKWSGWLLGHEGQIYIDLAPAASKFSMKGQESLEFFKPYKNVKLALSWYTMGSGRYEVLSYVA